MEFKYKAGTVLPKINDKELKINSIVGGRLTPVKNMIIEYISNGFHNDNHYGIISQLNNGIAVSTDNDGNIYTISYAGIVLGNIKSGTDKMDIKEDQCGIYDIMRDVSHLTNVFTRYNKELISSSITIFGENGVTDWNTVRDTVYQECEKFVLDHFDSNGPYELYSEDLYNDFLVYNTNLILVSLYSDTLEQLLIEKKITMDDILYLTKKFVEIYWR